MNKTVNNIKEEAKDLIQRRNKTGDKYMSEWYEGKAIGLMEALMQLHEISREEYEAFLESLT